MWARQELPAGWASTFNGGTLVVRWKDQGWGNRKGHIWGRLCRREGQGHIWGRGISGEWHRLSSNVAPHAWATGSFPLPAGWFNGTAGACLLELALEVGGGGGHSLHIRPGAELSLEPRRLFATVPAAVLLATAAAVSPSTTRIGDGPMVGDCLEVQDTHGLWAVARVVGCIEEAALGPLALVHFEGWSTSWLMWLSRTHDAARVRPLSRVGIDGTGSRGPHDATSLREIVAEARRRIVSGEAWRPTGGSSYQTFPFRQPNTTTFQPQVRGAAAEMQLGAMHTRSPFLSSRDLLPNRALCEEMHRRFAGTYERPS